MLLSILLKAIAVASLPAWAILVVAFRDNSPALDVVTTVCSACLIGGWIGGAAVDFWMVGGDENEN